MAHANIFARPMIQGAFCFYKPIMLGNWFEVNYRVGTSSPSDCHWIVPGTHTEDPTNREATGL
jgi:hypothetical protein